MCLSLQIKVTINTEVETFKFPKRDKMAKKRILAATKIGGHNLYATDFYLWSYRR